MTDEERWEQALSIARGTPSPPALDRQRRSRRNLLVWGSVLVVVCVAAGAVAGFLFGGSDSPRGDDDGWRLLPEPWSLVAFVVGLGLEVTGFVLLVRAGQWGARWKTAVSVLTRAQRRSVLRQMRGRAPVVPEQLPVVVDLARRVVLMDRLLLVFAGLVVLQTGNIGDEPVWLLVLLLLGVVAVTVGAVALLVERRRALRFLQQHAPS